MIKVAMAIHIFLNFDLNSFNQLCVVKYLTYLNMSYLNIILYLYSAHVLYDLFLYTVHTPFSYLLLIAKWSSLWYLLILAVK